MSLHLHTPLPPLDGATEWIPCHPKLITSGNTAIMIYFWALSCNICHDNMPKIQALRKEYGPKGLQVISIHCPRMKTDVNVEAVKQAVEKYEIKEPVGIDNKHKIKKAFENEYWPAFFVFDSEERLVRRAAGKNGLSMVESIICKMLD